MCIFIILYYWFVVDKQWVDMPCANAAFDSVRRKAVETNTTYWGVLTVCIYLLFLFSKESFESHLFEDVFEKVF